MALTEEPHVLRFDDFTVNPRARSLYKHGVRLKLHGQPFEILLLLLGRPGEAVTREELQAKLWSGDTFVDFEHGLNTAIKKLRQTLGDSAGEPRFIETVPRVGYRFIAPVSVGVEPVHQVGPSLQTAVEEPARKKVL
ncbi:MAG: winged helix-turn-helix domain-containing protein, partial [Candidatus Acidiferrales bacterium]